jgi:hypothetical protein
MISRNIGRIIGPWLLGLYIVAQVAGMMPLVGAHLQHVIAAEQDMAEDVGNTGVGGHAHHHHVHSGSGHHDHGAADPNDQCCTLHHHLTGVLPHAAGAGANSLRVAAIVSLLPRAFMPADPGMLERPPKLPFSV